MDEIVEFRTAEEAVSCPYGFRYGAQLLVNIIANTVSYRLHIGVEILVLRNVNDTYNVSFYMFADNFSVGHGQFQCGIGNKHGVARRVETQDLVS